MRERSFCCQMRLEIEDESERTKVVKAIGGMFASPGSTLAEKYPSMFAAWCKRSVAILLDRLALSKKCINWQICRQERRRAPHMPAAVARDHAKQARATRAGSPPFLTKILIKTVLQLLDRVQSLLLDAEETVRKMAIKPIIDLAKQDLCAVKEAHLEEVARRCYDKKVAYCQGFIID